MKNNIHFDFQYNRVDFLMNMTVFSNTFFKASRQYEHAIALNEIEFHVIMTDVNFIQTRYTIDDLKRIRQVEKQNDDDQYDDKQKYHKTFHFVLKQNYNELDQNIKTIEINWLKTNEKPIKQRDNQKNKYDD